MAGLFNLDSSGAEGVRKGLLGLVAAASELTLPVYSGRRLVDDLPYVVTRRRGKPAPFKAAMLVLRVQKARCWGPRRKCYDFEGASKDGALSMRH